MFKPFWNQDLVIRYVSVGRTVIIACVLWTAWTLLIFLRYDNMIHNHKTRRDEMHEELYEDYADTEPAVAGQVQKVDDIVNAVKANIVKSNQVLKDIDKELHRKSNARDNKRVSVVPKIDTLLGQVGNIQTRQKHFEEKLEALEFKRLDKFPDGKERTKNTTKIENVRKSNVTLRKQVPTLHAQKMPDAKLHQTSNISTFKFSNHPSIPRGIVYDMAPADAPGEYGSDVYVNVSKLSPEDKARYDKGLKMHAFNQYVSDLISVHRRLLEARTEACRKVVYRKKMPTASIIICFHNEAWSVLLRTIHSIFDRSPPNLLREIVLVDDLSTMDHLKVPLENYINQLQKVKLIRTKAREGLIRARLLGYAVSVAPVIIFLDSHIECWEGWLEPLLDRIVEDPTRVVSPLIGIVHWKTFSVLPAAGTTMGVFNIEEMTYRWANISHREKTRRKSTVDPIRTPTIAGGLFAIDRKWFQKIGLYDDGMEIWGGENLEMSFKVWMCGGSLELHPCSHVSHVFRERSPYSWGKSYSDILRKNAVRVAEVWLDEYKHYYYQKLGYKLGDYGDVSGRKKLRQDLQCKSFDWYIKNVYPEIRLPPKAIKKGEIRSRVGGSTSLCLDTMFMKQSNSNVKTNVCHSQGGNQFWMLTDRGEIRNDNGCLDFQDNVEIVTFKQCHGSGGSQKWIFSQDGHIFNKESHKCAERLGINLDVVLRQCTDGYNQLWEWK